MEAEMADLGITQNQGWNTVSEAQQRASELTQATQVPHATYMKSSYNDGFVNASSPIEVFACDKKDSYSNYEKAQACKVAWEEFTKTKHKVKSEPAKNWLSFFFDKKFKIVAEPKNNSNGDGADRRIAFKYLSERPLP